MRKLEISKVHDAYERGGECPLCDLQEAAEQGYLRSFEHSRGMEPDVRVRTNREGFCAGHLRKLYAGENRLGLGLVMHTRLQALAGEVGAALQDAAAHRGRRHAAKTAERVANTLQEAGRSCYICRMLDQDLQRYAFTILYLWTRDPGFPPVFRSSKGFCLPHFELVLREALRAMSPDRRARWLGEAGAVLRASLLALENDLLAFTQLHRAENRGLGTEEERSALARTLRKLAGVAATVLPDRR